MCRTHCCGGANGVGPSLISQLWRATTFPFRVSPLTSLAVVQHLQFKFLATTVDVERVFSQGRLVLSHVQSRLSVQSTRALLCLGAWCRVGLVKGSEMKAALGDLDDVVGKEDELLADWDAI